MDRSGKAKGKALITGASTGIGAVYADRLAKRGYDLILVARDGARLDALAKRLSSETGRRMEVVVADLTDKEKLSEVEAILKTDSALSLLVNNAAYTKNKTFVESDADELENMIALNMTALTRLSHAAAQGFLPRKAGTIINIGSGIAMMPEIANAVYGGSKAYVLNFTRNIAAQLKPLGITVQIVLPGAILTEAWERSNTDKSLVPEDAFMTSEDMVDASMAGLDAKEVVTFPSLQSLADWEAMEEARIALVPQIFKGITALRYRDS